MRTVLKNLVYDTEKAKAVTNWENMEDTANPNHFVETLYQKRTGEFFIHGEGGCLSPYGKALKNSWVQGEAIKPVSVEVARAWMKEHRPDVYDSIFGKIDEPETGETSVLHVVVDEGIIKKAQRLASKNGCSLTVMVENLIRQAE